MEISNYISNGDFTILPHSFQHAQARVETYYHTAKDQFEVTALCCEKKMALGVTMEFLHKTQLQVPGVLLGMLWAEFKEFIDAHPPIGEILKKYAKGTLQYDVDEDENLFSSNIGKMSYATYKWQPEGEGKENTLTVPLASGGHASGTPLSFSVEYEGTFPSKFITGGPDPMVDRLPGVNETVMHPVSKTPGNLQWIIINLNDSYQWSREQIADWLETLDIDLEFKVEGGEENEQDGREVIGTF